MLVLLPACAPSQAEASEERVELDPRPAAPDPVDLEHVGPVDLSARPAPRQPADPAPRGELSILIDGSSQTLYLMEGTELLHRWPVSTSKVGLGNQAGSNRTPTGRHRIAQKFGASMPLGTVFRARQATEQRAVIHTDGTDVAEDLVMTRILWLEGLEPGINRGLGIDSYERYIYIHGTNEEGLIGRPASHGCVRMLNRHVIELFDAVSVGTTVRIRE